MVYNSDIDAAVDEIKRGMVLIRRYKDTYSVLLWLLLLEINKALTTEDIPKALKYLKEIQEMPQPSSREEVRDVYAHIHDAYERISRTARPIIMKDSHPKQSIVKSV